MSKALECLLDIENNYKFYVHNKQDIEYQCNIIKQALTTKSKKEEAWEIVVKKGVNFVDLYQSVDLYTYNSLVKGTYWEGISRELTEEEFNLLKRRNIMDTTRKTLEERFRKLYKNCEPLCFQLDGFTHRVYFIDLEGYSIKREESTDYMGAGERSMYDEMTDRCKVLFMGYPNYAYQNNPQEIVLIGPDEIVNKIKELRGGD